jgi:hypothetical protein
MKSILTTAALLVTLVSATTAQAGEKTWTILYPKEHCAEIVSQEYSTGGGKTGIQSVEILCKDAEGNYNGFVGSKVSASGYLGFGRMTMPDRLVYKPYNGRTLEIRD